MKKRKRHGPEEIIKKLREAELAAGRGEDLAKTLQRLEVSEQTLYRWKKQYGGMKAPDAKRLKELERQNAQLKKLVADHDLTPAKWSTRCERLPPVSGQGVPLEEAQTTWPRRDHQEAA